MIVARQLQQQPLDILHTTLGRSPAVFVVTEPGTAIQDGIFTEPQPSVLIKLKIKIKKLEETNLVGSYSGD